MNGENGRHKKPKAPKLETPTPAFDIGFQLQSQNNLENQLGQVAIDTETNYEALANQLDAPLTQMQTNTSMLQTGMQEHLYKSLNQAQMNTTLLQQHIEGGMAAAMGRAIEQTAVSAPQDQYIQELANQIRPSPPGISQSSSVVQQTPLTTAQAQAVIAPVRAGVVYLSYAFWANITCDQIAALVAQGPIQINAHYQVQVIGVGFRNVAPPGISAPPVCQVRVVETLTYPNLTQSADNWFTVPAECCNAPAVPPPPPGSPPIPPIPPLPPHCPPPPPPQYICQQIKFPDCIKLCPDEKKKEECIEPEYCLMCTDAGTLYIIKKEDTPRSSSDRKVQCGKASSFDFANALKECTQKKQEQQVTYTQGDEKGWQFQRGSGCDGLWNFPYLTQQPGDGFFKAVLGATQSDEGGKTSNLSLADEIGETIKATLVDAIGLLPATALNLVRSLALAIPCGGTDTGVIITARAVLGLVSKYISGVFDHDDASLEYSQNFNCPWKLPSAEQATQQYLSNTINLERLICLVKANGYKWEVFQPTVEANRTRLNSNEVLSLWRRRKITDAQTDEYLRQLGYVYEGERIGLGALTEQIPVVSDIVSMMLRDVADEVTIDWSESDRIFKNKWTGQLQEWGYNQGIPDLMAKYIWRAHWRLPSPTQIGEFWNRLRKKPEFGGEAKLKQRLRNVLLQDDYHPDWVDAYMAVINHPLTRIDARRAFEVGVLSQKQLAEAFNELGYTDENAETLVKFSERQLTERYKKSSYVTMYANGEISNAELDQQLRQIGLPSEVVYPVLEYAKFKLTLNKRKACVKSYKKRFMLGEFKVGEVASKLASDGLDPTQVASITAAWDCEKNQRGKDVGAAVLCGWYERGVIDEVEMYTRLKNLHYSEDDAAKLVRDCMLRAGIKFDKDQLRKLQQAQRQQRQAEAAAAKLARQLAKGTQQTGTQQTAASKAREHRQKLIIKIGVEWSKKTGMDLGDSIIGVRRVVDNAIANGIAPLNTVYTAAEAAAKDPAVTTFQQLATEVATLLIDVG
jgi:hypothetical protein